MELTGQLILTLICLIIIWDKDNIFNEEFNEEYTDEENKDKKTAQIN